MRACTCGSDDRGGGPEDHDGACRVRTGFTPNSEADGWWVERVDRGVARTKARHRAERWAGLRRRLARVGVVRTALDVAGLSAFVVMGGMLHPIAGVGIFGVACLAMSWLLDDER